ncbi:MAG: hypothetical protein GC184_06090 [Rhizobiales bacterium]|nr:hypothetical protein [Hyphomicrobiales bacterium]
MAYNRIIDAIILREGSRYTNRPNDRGGPTKYGITLKKLAEWRNHVVIAADVMNLTEPEARAIYTHEFIVKPGFDLVQNESLQEALIDYGVNSGPRQAIKTIQTILSLVVDGVLGPKTVAAINGTSDPRRLTNQLCCERLRFLGRLVDRDHSQVENIYGWINRVTGFIR